MILDHLTYIIEADNRKLDGEIKKSEKGVKDFEKSLSDTEKRAKQMTDKVAAGFKRLGGAIIAAVAINKVIDSVGKYAEATEKTRLAAENMGAAVEDVSAFENTVQSLGGTSDAARQSLENLSDRIGSGLRDATGSQAKLFADMGISLRDASGEAKNATQIMLELAEAMEGKTSSEAGSIFKELGIRDPKTIEAMTRGRGELERLMRTQKESGVVTAQSAEQARLYTLAQARMASATSNASDKMAAALLPLFTRMINGFSAVVEWINKNEHFVKGFLVGLATILLVTYAPAMGAAAVATWAFLAPILAIVLPIAAAAAAFALLYDDIMNFMEGNDSLIGQISEKYPAVGEYFKALYNVVAGVFKLLTGDFEGAKEAFSNAAESIMNVFGAMGKAILGVFDSLLSVFGLGDSAATEFAGKVTGTFTNMADMVVSVFKGMIDFVGKAWDWISGIYDKTVGMVSGIGSWVGDKLGFGGGSDDAKKAITAAEANPYNSVTSNQVTNQYQEGRSNNVLQISELNIQTQATDAQGVSSDIRSELAAQLSNLQDESASGVAR